MSNLTGKISSDKLKKNVKAIGKILSVLSIVFIGVKIYKLGFDPTVVEGIPAFIGISVIAVFLKMLSVAASASGWGRWISLLSGKKICFREVLYIYGKSGIGKYVPGNVMQYVGRNVFAAEYGLSQPKIALGSVIEALELIVIAVFMAVIMLPVSFKDRVLDMIVNRKTTMVVILIISITVPLALALVLFLKREDLKALVESYKFIDVLITVIFSVIEYCLTLILLGSGMVLLWMYCTELVPDAENLKLIISAYSTAWVCGFVIPGASGGIGIREAILSVLLEGIASGPVIMFIIVAHRLITIIGDFGIYLLVSLRGRSKDVS